MGRNFSAATPLARQLVSEMEHFGKMLPPQDRIILKRLGEYVLNNRSVIANAASLEPFDVMLMLLLIEHRKQTDRKMGELRAELERLTKEAKRPPGYRFRDTEQP